MPEQTAPRTRRRPAYERAVATADRLFYEQGIHAVGVDQIAAAADISKASLYTHFRTKDDLVVGYLTGRSTAWQEHVAAELPSRGETARDRLLAVFDMLGEWFVLPGYHGCPFINAEAEYGEGHPTHEVTLAHRDWVRQLFEGLLTEAGHDDPTGTALQLCLLYDGAMASAQADATRPWAAAARSAAGRLV
ncbi:MULTISPECIES: TetR/AcrR family transcriptional regulator [unclassified Curtobacterium]|uniref:TetR/AcrR family transcriptional regulator n=1 Tax=unclassified Curtobacterium TaxID=257496 RepID=UPI000F4CE672|nr:MULTISPECIES: TetR/AcrR family transcriptional regulator [unclassified Curtobacterium]ROP63520.1 TetR family transcriptional regulator [Curtobacterium sp. ZW137]TCK66004.1 TetR family transcriptional regulator [Curtobacterium sp. PhB136]